MMLLIDQAQGDTLSISLAAGGSRALEANPTLLAERAEVRAQQAEIAGASGAFLPTVRVEMTGVLPISAQPRATEIEFWGVHFDSRMDYAKEPHVSR